MTKVYCPMNDIQKMDSELQNFTVKNNDVAAYTQRFQELSLLCPKMVPEEEDKIERDNYVQQQPPFKRQNVARAYTVRANEKKAYVGTMPYCNKCKLHHAVPCTVKYGNCKRIGYMTRDCKALVDATIQRALVETHKTIVTCFKCRRQGHYKSDCPKLNNQNRKNHDGNGEVIMP
ncbi:reverse transcriptase domain-containing protein [Tanacetum coccineum]